MKSKEIYWTGVNMLLDARLVILSSICDTFNHLIENNEFTIL